MFGMIKYMLIEMKGEARQVYFMLLSQPGWFSVPVLLYALFWRTTVGLVLHSVGLAIALIAILAQGIAKKLAPKVPGYLMPEPEAFILEANAYTDKLQYEYDARQTKIEKEMR